MSEELVTVRVDQDGVEVGNVTREKDDLVDIPESEAEILEKSGVVDILDDAESAAEAEEKQDEEKEDDEFVLEVKPGGLPEGKHKGTIIDLEKREVELGNGGTATYLDLQIDVASVKEDTQVTAGYPFNISQNSRLGKLLKRFGKDLDVGENINVKDVVVGRPITFLVQEDDEGYSNVLPETVKPAD